MMLRQQCRLDAHFDFLSVALSDADQLHRIAEPFAEIDVFIRHLGNAFHFDIVKVDIH